MLRSDLTTYLSLFIKFILSQRLSNSLWESDVLLFSEFIMHYTFVEFIILLYTFILVSFAQYNKYTIWLISFNKFSDVQPDMQVL